MARSSRSCRRPAAALQSVRRADRRRARLGAPRCVVAPHESKIARYYYSKHDHTINPSWTPDGKRLVFVSNREIAYGTGDLCSAARRRRARSECFVHEETSWRARPEVAPDGRRVLYSSYQGRQWHQLWLTTLAGDAQLPLTFGEFDATRRALVAGRTRASRTSATKTATLRLWVLEVVGGERNAHRRTRAAVRASDGDAEDSAHRGRAGSASSASDDALLRPDDAGCTRTTASIPCDPVRGALLPLPGRMRGDRAGRRNVRSPRGAAWSPRRSAEGRCARRHGRRRVSRCSR